jgi:hypothetical protein
MFEVDAGHVQLMQVDDIRALCQGSQNLIKVLIGGLCFAFFRDQDGVSVHQQPDVLPTTPKACMDVKKSRWRVPLLQPVCFFTHFDFFVMWQLLSIYVSSE